MLEGVQTIGDGMGGEPAAAQARPGMADRFIKILTRVMEVQDPLAPMDQGQLFDQIARLTELAGLEEQRSALGEMVQRQAALERFAAVDLVGRRVRVPIGELDSRDPGVDLSSLEIPAPGSERVTVRITDASGRLVEERTVAVDEDGRARLDLANLRGRGRLRVEAVATDADGNEVPLTVLVAAEVRDVRYEGDRAVLETPVGAYAYDEVYGVAG